MLGMHGTYEANMAMQNCDVLLAIGARFDDRVIGNPKHFFQEDRKIIHVDIDPSSISKRVRVDVPDRRRCEGGLQEMNRQLAAAKERAGPGGGQDVVGADRRMERPRLPEIRPRRPKIIKPQSVVEKLYELTKDLDMYVTSDVGQHQMWAAQFYKFNKPRRWINSGGLGTMGVGLPYALGCPARAPESDRRLRHR